MGLKLSPDDVAAIRASREPTHIVAARYVVSISRVKEIRKGLMREPGGRPPGYPKSGGRLPGTQSKKTVYARQILEDVGADPVEMLARMMKDDENVSLTLRIDCAKALLPYVYPKLSAVEVSGPDGSPVRTENNLIIQSLMRDETVVERMEDAWIAWQAEAIANRGELPEICAAESNSDESGQP